MTDKKAEEEQKKKAELLQKKYVEFQMAEQY